MHVNYFIYTPILLFAFFLTLFVLLKDFKNNVNKVFGALGFSIVFWVLSLLFADTTLSHSKALLWCRLAIIGPAFIPSTFLYFIFFLIKKFPKLNSFVLFIPSLVIVSFTLTKFNVRDVVVHSWGAEVFAGPLYYALLFYILFYFGLASYFMLKNYSKSNFLLKKQVKYVFWGYGLSIIFGLVTNLMLVMIGFSRLSVFGPFSGLIFISFIAYTITFHHLMDIEFVIKRSLVYSGLVAIIFGFYSIITFLLGFVLVGEKNTMVALTLQSVAVAIGFKPLESYLSRITDRYFFKGKYDYRETLKKVTSNMTSIMKLSLLLEMLADTILKEMRVSNVSIFLREDDKYFLKMSKSSTNKTLTKINFIPASHVLIDHFKRHKSVIHRNKIIINRKNNKQNSNQISKENQILETIEELKSDLLFPYLVKSELIGFISIGERLSGDLFSKEDIQLLETLANQSAISIENARLYGKSIERIAELLALYEVGKAVTSISNLDDVLQTILSAVINVVNVDRGVIFLYDVSNNKLTAKAAKGREKDVANMDYKKLSLPVEGTVFGNILKTGEPIIRTEVKKNAEVKSRTYLNLLEVDSYVAVPLRSNDNIVGVLAVDNKMSGRSIASINMDLLITLAGHAAVAIENARLYQETKSRLDELKVLNAELIEMKNYNQDIIAGMMSALIVVDNEGIIRTFNAQAEKITGKKKKEVIGKKPIDIWTDSDGFFKLITSPPNKKKPFNQISFKKGSDILHISLTMTPLKDHSKKVKGKLIVINDLTEMKSLELQVRRSDKLSALGRMAAGVAHEIKNPLTSMRLFIQMMATRFKKDPSFWDNHNEILLNEIDRLNRIVVDFVDFAKSPEIEWESVRLIEIIEKVLRLIKVQAQESKVQIEVMVDGDIFVRGDAQRLTQIILNLVLNALQAMTTPNHKGLIVIKAKEYKSKIIKIEIADNGCGIPKEHIDKLFTPFFTTKERGTGLGLSIIHKLVEEHDGSIDVKSKEGKGTTFVIKLPIPRKADNIIPVEIAGQEVSIS